MREFFEGWRRKVGFVILAMACALMLVWMRSSFVTERFSYYPSDEDYQYSLRFDPSGLSWIRKRGLGQHFEPRFYNFNWETNEADSEEAENVTNGWGPEWSWTFCGFHFGNYELRSTPALHEPHTDGQYAYPLSLLLSEYDIGVIPYWSVVFPVTLSSAWFLLVPSRKRF